VYFFMLGLLNSRPRPQLLSGRTDFILLTAAMLPVFFGPVLGYLGVSVWGLLAAAGVMLAGAAVLAPPRAGSWVIYNASASEALRASERALRTAGEPFLRQGRKLVVAGGDAALRLRSVPLLRNVSVCAEGACPPGLTRRFAAALGEELGRIHTRPSRMAVTFLLLATAMMVAPLGLFADRMPELVRILTDLVR